ncbi:sedoheptulokinase [Micropterus dolomieu]|uniref:sedoheptulokinase n=1 Tax=Micropterus dolomieu TaxID=147949 RepID=UPI001E8D30FE|nr:sedoheptulokinase [Micropterus dolomieu]XP_045896155.1 sedoheptulokinase [Micropterus dolomieu]XP_045896156.1 sedoheptulokinase [Micropterus dolomieu]XP_045896157.1 sedoheptulokinase [Micropterus dolomieu]
MSTYILGVDVGTTSVKAVLLKTGSREVAASHALPTTSDIIDSSGIKAKEQDTGRIIDTLNRCIRLLPRDKLQHVSSIGLTGQMHGVLFWKAKSGCDWSNRDFFTARDTSQLITWQDGRCSCNFLSSLPKPDSHISVATGFGCATIFWCMKHRPEFLKDFTVAGTIQDYVVSMLCGLDSCVMTPQNAASWGFFNTSSNQWNIDILKGAGFPFHLLPQCVPSGGLAGQTCSDWHGIPAGTPVGAAMGDFQCSVYSCMGARTDAVLNISTSAQLTFAMPADFQPPDSPEPASSISYFPYFDNSYLAVAASLNGGNVLATFVEMLSAWMKELGAELSDSCLYEKLIHCALNQETSDLSVSPTILGERHNPLCLGQVTNISTTNLSLGHMTRALCRGILDNITSMMPAERLQQAGVSRIVASGSAIARNEVLRQEVEKAFPQPVVYGQNADSAAGVAMVLCDLL